MYMYLQLSKTNLKGLRSGYCTGAGTLVFYDSGYRSYYMRDLSHMEVIRKTLYLNSIRNFINISSFHNLLDVIYTEISGKMKQFTVWIGMQCDRLLFDKIDNCALNHSVNDSGLVVNAFGY